MTYDIDLIVEISYLYYKSRLKQESIARELNISRYKVTRVLKSALRNGIVQFKIIDPTIYTPQFGENIEKDFNSKDCILGRKI